MYVDKQTTAKWLINCAIRNIFAGECAVANHVIVQAARELLHEYAGVHKIKLTFDAINYVKPEYASKFAALLKERYNFFKHSSRDADQEIDITNIQVTNEAETFENIAKFQQLFGTLSQHMLHFIPYFMARAPELWKVDELPFPPESIQEFISIMKEFSSKPREKLCEAMLTTYRSIPAIVGELREVQAISLSEEHKYDKLTKNIHKAPYFKRKKNTK